MQIRYIADMHFDHEEIIAYDNRPFADTREMNHVLSENWNRVCGAGDLTYIIGDFCAGGPDRWRELLSSLSGRKYLIAGNHDNMAAAEQMVAEGLLDGCSPYLEITDNRKPVVLCHYPIVPFHNHYFGAFHLYGHVHTGYEWNMTEHQKYLLRNLYARRDICRMANAGAMLSYMDYTPRSLDELAEKETIL